MTDFKVYAAARPSATGASAEAIVLEGGLIKKADAAAMRAASGLATTTVAGRLARYTDTAGAQGSTTGLFEDASGNVGIGTTGPASVLDVSGSQLGRYGIIARYTRSIGNFYSPLSVQNDAGLTTFAVGSNQTVDEGQLILAAPTGQGNGTGINFVSDVGGTTKSGTFQMDNAGNMIFRQSTAGSMFFDYISGVYFRDSAYATRAFIANGTGNSYFNGGNVGIGTTAPRVKLDVSGPVAVGSYTVATVPSAALGAGQIIYVSNDSGGATLAFSDGTNWRRTSDNAIIS